MIRSRQRQAASSRTSLPVYREAVRPAFERLVAGERIGAWGMTAAHPPSMVETVLAEEPTPAVAQMIANVLDAPGDMRWSDERPVPAICSTWLSNEESE
jgi:hypothetical protein